MASVTEVRLVDDLDGSEGSKTVNFGLDGKHFEIDLSTKNADKLREFMGEYVAAARRKSGNTPTRSLRTPSSATRREETSAVREWAAQNGFQVSARGRISAAVIDAYNNRGSAPVAEAATVEVEPKPKRQRRSRKAAEPS